MRGRLTHSRLKVSPSDQRFAVDGFFLLASSAASNGGRQLGISKRKPISGLVRAAPFRIRPVPSSVDRGDNRDRERSTSSVS